MWSQSKSIIYTFTIICLCIGQIFCDQDLNLDYEVNKFSLALTKDSFDNQINANNLLVLFYSPGCELSSKFIPNYERFAEVFNNNENLKLATVDCDKYADFCTAQSAQAFDLFFYKKEERNSHIKFNGVRTIGGFTKFFIKQLGDQIFNSSEVEIPESLAPINELTADTFNDHVVVGQHFVKFYAPWCGHCQRLAPAWDELASALEYDDAVSISKIDCTLYRPICQNFEVRGYPTLLWIVDGKKVEKYTGPRSYDDLKAYVEKTAGGNRNKREQNGENDKKKQDGEGVSVVQLSTQNFEHAIAKGVTFVKFFAPWCGHCKRMAPTWDELANKFIGNDLVKIAKVDCTLADNKELCSEQDVNGFPTMFIYKDGGKLTEYNGSRTLDDLYEFVKRYSTRDEL